MGPSLSGLEGLLRLPTGCGEQNMVLFAPNIFVMQYLNSTNQLTNDIKTKAEGFLRTGNDVISCFIVAFISAFVAFYSLTLFLNFSGYQREMTFKRKDGSYSAFGDRDNEGSLW